MIDYTKLNIPEAQQKKLKNFIEVEILKTKFWRPDGKPKKKWKIFYGETWDAAWGATRDAARGAARDAAWDAAWGAPRGAAWGAARDAARDAAWDAAWGAVWDAARDAAWDAARDAARDAAWDAVWDAARGAAFQTYFIITEDLDYKDKAKHTKYAKELWEIYKKGYGCVCDINGVFYVYGVKE